MLGRVPLNQVPLNAFRPGIAFAGKPGSKQPVADNGTRSPLLPGEATAKRLIFTLQQNDVNAFKATLSDLGSLSAINPNELPFQPVLEKLMQLDTPAHPSHVEMMDAMIQQGLNPNLKIAQMTPLIWLLTQSHLNAQPVLNTLNKMEAANQKAERYYNADPSCLSILLSYCGKSFTDRKGTNRDQATALFKALLAVSEPLSKLEKREIFQRILEGFGDNPRQNKKEAKNMPWPDLVKLLLAPPYQWDLPPEGFTAAYKGHFDDICSLLLTQMNGPNQDQLTSKNLSRLIVTAMVDDRPGMVERYLKLPNVAPLTRQQSMEKALEADCSPEMLSAIIANGQVNPSALSIIWNNLSTLHVLASNKRFGGRNLFDFEDGIEENSQETRMLRSLRDRHLAKLLTAPELADVRINVNVLDKDQFTPLMYACTDGNVAAARLLLEAGANPHLKDHVNRTALDLVKAYQNRWPEAVQGAMMRLIEGYSRQS